VFACAHSPRYRLADRAGSDDDNDVAAAGVVHGGITFDVHGCRRLLRGQHDNNYTKLKQGTSAVLAACLKISGCTYS
jgi:hypothetical protein